ncbi:MULTISPECIES: prephenate dehydratase [Methylobacterium]|jgi:prephenate dehydratase|uniref:prephenate dehydratase n=1 Tax=Methylobacterium longum TaxID=767694 RepID=A0ABT8AIN7_9HYPH|nr:MULTISPECIES: prephenate dehydratase [Methylobacterium]MCJ2100365.1 prephenate dehydratase [Methylobacterium sp. E-046]MDN3569562.1 prephenate dehydratase [Methylobacterium longum]GJE10781.1 Bifunctional chorismate mutase/prephenate dehydratase [Methylobacterium longum]
MTDRTIAYQGEPGANSHIICAEAYPDWTPLPCATFEDAFAAVTEGRAQRAMIPIENSIAGRVADIHHLIPLSPLHIVAEHFLPIHFQLMVLPGTGIEALRSVHSHIHALGQCRRIIRRLGLKAVVAGDTAGAAREVAEIGDPSRAALAPALAAEVYGLDILERDVEDEVHNTTRFVVFSPEAEPVAQGTQACVTSFVFRVRNIPAALYKALGGFATNGVNMSKLESYMMDGEFTATQFYAEVDGHPEDPGLARALDELGFFSRELRVIGTYPAHPFREAARPAAE